MEVKTLNQWRKLRGLSVDQLADLSGAGLKIEKYLYRGAKPRDNMLRIRLASALEVTEEQITWGRPPEATKKAEVPSMPKSPPFDPRVGTPVISDEQMEIAAQWAAGGYPKREVYGAMGVSYETFQKALERYEAVHGPVTFIQSHPAKATSTEAVQKAAAAVVKAPTLIPSVPQKVQKVDMADLPPMPKSPPFNPVSKETVVSDKQLAVMVQWAAGGYSKSEIAKAMGVSRQTFYAALERYEALHGPVTFAKGQQKPTRKDVQPQGAQKARKGGAAEAVKGEPSSRSRKAANAIL